MRIAVDEGRAVERGGGGDEKVREGDTGCAVAPKIQGECNDVSRHRHDPVARSLVERSHGLSQTFIAYPVRNRRGNLDKREHGDADPDGGIVEKGLDARRAGFTKVVGERRRGVEKVRQ